MKNLTEIEQTLISLNNENCSLMMIQQNFKDECELNTNVVFGALDSITENNKRLIKELEKLIYQEHDQIMKGAEENGKEESNEKYNTLFE
ncbi:MAG: hypothetical protein LUH02_01230 [Erysipelotrichaceae bacterium]|nr:hypothetical protein [Erysipelotrichaceae bacterium]